MDALSQVGLDGFENRKIQALSGGQQQRVALARSLVKKAKIVLLDEPLVNLDYKLREQLREEFRGIFDTKASEDCILIYSSTDPVEAMQLGGQILVMDEGRILQQASAKEIYENNQKSIFSDKKMNEFESGLNEKINKVNINEILGAKELIKKLEKETDLGICYATGSLRRPAEHKLKSIGINFEDIQLVASDKILERENIVQKAIQNAQNHYGIEKFDRIISVGDGLWDLLTAKNLDIEFIGVGLKNKETLIENGAKKIFENLLHFDI